MIRLNDIVVKFGDFTALHSINVHVKEGEFFTFLGPSGCGKTTTLRMIAGFTEPTAGQILVDGKNVSTIPPYRRNIGIFFQNYALFPHMTVFENVAFGLKLQKLPKNEIRERVEHMLALVKLTGMDKRYPRQLSGGQQQRVAIARALALHPDILCFDEPTSALDPELTGEVLSVMRQLAEEGMTMLVVTHEMGFARNVSSKTVFMENGVVVEQAPSQQFFASPKEERTRAFLRRIAHTE